MNDATKKILDAATDLDVALNSAERELKGYKKLCEKQERFLILLGKGGSEDPIIYIKKFRSDVLYLCDYVRASVTGNTISSQMAHRSLLAQDRLRGRMGKNE